MAKIDFKNRTKEGDQVPDKKTAELIARKREQYTNTAVIKNDAMAAEMVLATYDQQVDEIVDKSMAVTVKDDGTSEAANSLIKLSNSLVSQFKVVEKDLTGDAAAYVTATRQSIRRRTDKITGAIRHLKDEMKAWAAKLRLEAQRRAEEQRKELEARQAQLNKDAKTLGMEAPKIPVAPVKEDRPVVRSEHGTGYMKGVWKARIVDAAKVPKVYKGHILCEPTMPLINAAIKGDNGLREIPGVEIWYDEDWVTR